MQQFTKFKEAITYAKNKDKTLTVKKFNGKDRLFLYHADCSIFSILNFLVETIKIEFNNKKEDAYIIYTEHHGFHVYFASDLRSLKITKYLSEIEVIKTYKTTFLK